MTIKLTRERIELIANFHRAMTLPPSHDEIEELARMALAAMDSEPVIVVGDDGGDALSYHRLIQSFAPGTKLYRHAQPSPEMKPVGYLFVSGQGAIAYSPTNWGMPGFRLIGQIYGDIDVESQPAPVVLVVPDEMTPEQAHEIGDYYGDPVDVFARGANWMRQHIIDSTIAASSHEVKK